MRHLKRRSKLGKTSAHRRCMLANMLKSLIEHDQIETSLVKAKELRRYADKLVTIAKSKKDLVAAKRLVKSKLMITFNSLTSKQRKEVKDNNLSSYNVDRKVIKKLFTELKDRYQDKNGGYTRIIKKDARAGDGMQTCILEYIK